MEMSEFLKRWLRALAISIVLFILLSLYYFLRRGEYDISIFNKTCGSTAAVLAGVTLLIGPLRRIPFVVYFMTVRRQLGLLAFGFAFLHIFFSLYQTERFAWFSWYLEEWIPVTFGILAILVWVYMTYISRNTQIQKLGADVWKKRLSLSGQIAFVAIFLHLAVMKLQGWIRFFQGEQSGQARGIANPSYPPESLVVVVLMGAIIVYRIFISFKQRRNPQQEGK